MRRWTIFVVAATLITLLFPIQFLPNASAALPTRSVRNSQDAQPGKRHALSAAKTRSKAKAHKNRAARARARALAAERCEDMPRSYTGDYGVSTRAALVLDMENGQVLYAQDADAPIAPASLTKILTLYLINEHLRDGSLTLSTPIPVSFEASHAGGSNMHLRTGEMVPVMELMKGIAVASANDGCMAIAEYLGNGAPGPFVEAMNRKAQELGMTNTHFENPNGLPADGQVTTARDMATLAQAYLQHFPQMLAVHSMTEFTHNNRPRHNANSLLGKVEGVDGLKTGFVCASGFNIVATAKRNSTRLVAVVLGARNQIIREYEATRLLEEGFKIVTAQNFRPKPVAMAR